jgi:hypothetical protein
MKTKKGSGSLPFFVAYWQTITAAPEEVRHGDRIRQVRRVLLRRDRDPFPALLS